MARAKCVIGIDGGGTRSEAVVLTLEGDTIARIEGGPLNFCTSSMGVFATELNSLCRRLRDSIGERQCIAAVIGTAALFDRATSENQQRVFSGVDLSGLGRVDLVGDAMTAVYGATQGQPGLLVVAGTGSIGVRLGDSGQVSTIGGLGPMLGGDPGSAYWMVSQVVMLAQQNQSSTGELCPLGQKLVGDFGVHSLAELVEIVHTSETGRKQLAALARAFSDCEDEVVDRAWRGIEQAAGRALAIMLRPLLGQNDVNGNSAVYYTGSVLTQNTRVRESFREALTAECEREVSLSQPSADAAMGAAWMALASGSNQTESSDAGEESRA